MRHTRKLLPISGDTPYEVIEQIQGDVALSITGLPKCMTKEDIANMLTKKIGWKAIAQKVVIDKFDRT